MNLQELDKPPRWAKSWCYLDMIIAIALALFTFLILLTLIFAYGALNKKDAVGIMTLYMITFGIQAISAMVFFWMCRSSLKSQE